MLSWPFLPAILLEIRPCRVKTLMAGPSFLPVLHAISECLPRWRVQPHLFCGFERWGSNVAEPVHHVMALPEQVVPNFILEITMTCICSDVQVFLALRTGSGAPSPETSWIGSVCVTCQHSFLWSFVLPDFLLFETKPTRVVNLA